MQAFILPRNLAALAKLTAKSTRYALGAVNLELHALPDGAATYAVAATDGKYGAIVSGPAEPADGHMLALPQLREAPNSATAALIPSEDWEAAFRALPKGRTAKLRPDMAAGIGCVLGPAFATLGASDGAGSQSVRQSGPVEGRFPALREVYPKGAPTATVKVDALRLAKLLEAAAMFAAPEENYPITLEVRGATTPVVVRASINGQEFTGIIMPLS